MFGNLLRTDFKRSLMTKKFAILVIGMILVELLSCGRSLLVNQFGVTELMDNLFAGTGSAEIILMLFPLIPFALAYAKDEQEHATLFWVVRAGAGKYMTSHFVIGCISAFLCVAVSLTLLCTVLFAMGHPLCWEEAYSMASNQEGGYTQLLFAGHPVAYLVTYIADRGLSAAMMAGCAMCISAIYPNEFISFTGPVCIYYVALRASSVLRVYQMPNYMHVTSWIEGTYDAPGGAIDSLLAKLGVTLLVCGVYGVVSVLLVRRRWQNA